MNLFAQAHSSVEELHFDPNFDDDIHSVKEMPNIGPNLDSYFTNKYLKYKAKYLSLKNINDSNK